MSSTRAIDEVAVKSVLIAHDFSETSDKPLRHALAIPRHFEAKFYVAHVVSHLGHTIAGSGALQLAVEKNRSDGGQLEQDLLDSGTVAGLQYEFILPAWLQEKSLVDFFAGHSEEIFRRIGKKVDLAQQKPYTGTHNSGYTECQEFFGAITLESQEPLGHQIITMLDVALRGIGDRWNDVVIPGFDFCVVENTLGKFGERVETLTKFPIRAQEFVGCVTR